MQTSLTSSPLKPIWSQISSVHLSLTFKNKDSDFAKQSVEVFKAVEKRHSKKIVGVTASSSKLVEETLLPMLIAIDNQTGEIVAQVTSFSEYFANKQAITPENAEKILRMKGVIENSGKFESHKEEVEYELSVGSSYLQNNLNSDEVDNLNKYIEEKEKIVELKIDAATVNYNNSLIQTYKGVEDPFETEIVELSYAQNPTDPSQVIREVTFKADALSDGSSIQN